MTLTRRQVALLGVPLGVSRADALRIAWLAVPNIIGWHLCSIVGLAQLPAGRAAVLAFTMPVWTVLLAVLLFGERMTARSWLAVVAAIAAVGLLAGYELVALAGHPVGVLWLQAGAFSWALGTVLLRRTRLDAPTEAVTVGMMLLGSVFFWLAAPLAVPLVGIASATAIVGEAPQPTDWLAALFVAAAIASATRPAPAAAKAASTARRAGGDNPVP